MKSPPEASTWPFTVLIADDHSLVRADLAAIFKAQNDINIVAEAANEEEALELCNRHLLMCSCSICECPKKRRTAGDYRIDGAQSQQTQGYRDDDVSERGRFRRALQAGAKGYLVKGTAPQQIREAVRAVAAEKNLSALRSNADQSIRAY